MSYRPWYNREPCGTEAAYRRHLRNGQKACPACLQAGAQAWTRRQQDRETSSR